MIEERLMSLGILFFFAILGGILATKFKQPVVIGLLLVGSIIGPNFLNLVKDQGMIEMIAEFGSILLLFVIGLEFVIPKLLKIGFKAVMIGVLKLGIAFFMTYEFAVLVGVSQQAAIVLGVMLSISSTVVIVKVLEAKGLYTRQEMPILIGVLLIEDIFAVIVLTFLSGVGGNSSVFSMIDNLVVSFTILLLAYLVMLKITPIIIPWFIKNTNEEMVTFMALGICAGFSYLAFALGMSPATGAFLAGSVLASLSQVKLFENAIKPYTLTFSSLFFISIGTMVDYMTLKENGFLLVVLIGIIIITRFLAVGVVSYLFANFQRNQMIFSSIAMISVGEFSLLIARAASPMNLGLDIISIAAFLIFITAILMSNAINYTKEVTDMFVTHPQGYKPRSFSNFMRRVTDEIDTQSTNSSVFKTKMLTSFFNILLLIFTIILGIKLISFMKENIIRTWHIYIGYALLTFAVLYFLVMIYYSMKSAFNSLALIITNMDYSGNIKRSKTLLKNLFLALILLLITVFSPMIVVVFKLPNWINLLSFGMLILIAMRFKKLFNVVHTRESKGNAFPKYKKISEINWKATDFQK